MTQSPFPDPELRAVDPARYCRDVETYLCRKNDGHLVRIVGPAFEQVCEWAERGVPLKVAFRGIDRYCERYYAKGGRRRPVRIEFCEADILEAFDDWRRALGVVATGVTAAEDSAEGSRRPALAAHMERALQRLRSIDAAAATAGDVVERASNAAGEVERLVVDARSARGEKRARIIERLSTLDDELVQAAVAAIDPAHRAELAREAELELASFGARMSPEVRDKAVSAIFHRLVRESLGLPTLTYE
jgi:hypothetical protein